MKNEKTFIKIYFAITQNRLLQLFTVLVIFSAVCFGQTKQTHHPRGKASAPKIVLENLSKESLCEEFNGRAFEEKFTGKIAGIYVEPKSKHLIEFKVKQTNGESIDIEIDDLDLNKENPALLKRLKKVLRVGQKVKVSVYVCGKTHWAHKIQIY